VGGNDEKVTVHAKTLASGGDAVNEGESRACATDELAGGNGTPLVNGVAIVGCGHNKLL
jgi:hypothetical protein